MSSTKGNAGEHLVMAELLARGFDAYWADRGNPAFDIACFWNPYEACHSASRENHIGWRGGLDGKEVRTFPERDPAPEGYPFIRRVCSGSGPSGTGWQTRLA